MAKEHYLVLARKWRPQTFEDVVGQEHITRTLRNAIASGRIGHAFLFIGSRGIGKTTTARVLAKALNCNAVDSPTPDPCGVCDNCATIAAGNNIDVVEIDGASNNGVDDIRQIRENIRLVPSRSRYKIYIIDEVHQLSPGAFNALLKTLEEPPAHAVFILATTEAAKIPATIVSRCQRYDFRRVGLDGIRGLLRRILQAEKIACSEEALNAIARAADGGVRDAQSILEQLISFCGDTITFQDVYDVLGLVDWRVLHELCDAILDKNVARQLEIVEEVVVIGKDLSRFVQDLLQYFRNLLVCKTADAKRLIALPEEDLAQMQQRADRFSLTDLIRLVEQFADLSKDFDSQLAQRIALEAQLIRISKVAVELSVDTVLEKLARLSELPLAAGAAPSTKPASRPAPAAPEPPPGGAAAASPPAPKTEPAPRDRKPAAPAEPSASAGTVTVTMERIEVTPDNMREFWMELAHDSSHDMLGVSIWLSHGRPERIDGDALVLSFNPEQTQARKIVEKPENRVRIEQALAETTKNIRTFRTEIVGEADSDKGKEKSNGSQQQRLPFAGHVTEADARTALANPHIAKVVEVFRGRIVDVVREHKPNPGK
jgi:DNA polymerase-3 subunit gamma/tau